MNGKEITFTKRDSLNERISSLWGDNVCTRAADLEQGTDISYLHVIKPWVIERVLQTTTPSSSILDVGCGCGYLSNAVYECGRPHVRGIDISKTSVQYAQERYPLVPFVCGDICNYVSEVKYDLCMAVMTINNLPDLEGFFLAARGFLNRDGRILMVIPHPCYWPQNHLNDVDYSYFQEGPYEYAFSTKGRNDYTSPVLYFHRTLETYFHYARTGGFRIEKLYELLDGPDKSVPDIMGIELILK